MLELATHVLPTVPVLLSSASLGLATIHFHDVTSDLGRLLTCQVDDNFGDLSRGAKSCHRNVVLSTNLQSIVFYLTHARYSVQVGIDE